MEASKNLLRENEVADMLNISVFTLQHWRNEKKGPPYIKLGTNIRYSREKVEAYLKARVVDPEGDAA